MLNPFFDKFLVTNSIKYKHNNFYLVNMPFVFLPTAILIELAARQDQELNKVIYYSVKDATKKKIMQQFNFDFGVEGNKIISLVEDFFTSGGWGGITNLDIDYERKRKLATVRSSPIAIPLQGKVDLPVDHFLRGIFAGLFSSVFKYDVDCVETQCSALGDSQCKFIIKPPEQMDFSKPRIRSQLRA